MDGDRSERRPHGRTVRDRGGYRAFVPAPLPRPIAWDAELVGVPYRLTVGARSLAEGNVELTERSTRETRLLTVAEAAAVTAGEIAAHRR